MGGMHTSWHDDHVAGMIPTLLVVGAIAVALGAFSFVTGLFISFYVAVAVAVFVVGFAAVGLQADRRR